MFPLSGIIDRNSPTDPKDSGIVKIALKALGYYNQEDDDFTPYTDKLLFSSIQNFQQDHKLKKDGIIKPDGPTHQKISAALEKSSEAGIAFYDFLESYFDMCGANTIDADKYFHCKANFEGTERGEIGEHVSKILSKGRLAYKKIKGDTSLDLFRDESSNIYGRETAKSRKFSSSREACAPFKPKGLNENY